MTNEEIEKMIAEIEEKIISCNGVCDWGSMKKIIKRFAKKAPEFRLTSQNEIQMLDLGIIETIGNDASKERLVLVVRELGRYCGEFLFTKELLKKHIENCQEMFEYLNDQEIDILNDIVQGHQL